MAALQTVSNVAQIGQLAVAVGSTYLHGTSSRANPQAGEDLDILDKANKQTTSTLHALLLFSQFTSLSPDIKQQYDDFDAEFKLINYQMKKTIDKTVEGILTQSQQKKDSILTVKYWQKKFEKGKTRKQEKLDEQKTRAKTSALTRRMLLLTSQITCASAEAERIYQHNFRKVQADITAQLDEQIVALYVEKDENMSTTDFIGTVARKAAAAVLPSENVEMYLTLFTTSGKLDLHNKPSGSGANEDEMRQESQEQDSVSHAGDSSSNSSSPSRGPLDTEDLEALASKFKDLMDPFRDNVPNTDDIAMNDLTREDKGKGKLH